MDEIKISIPHRRSNMKELNRTAVSVSHFNKTRNAVNEINNTGSSNVGFPPEVDPFIPMRYYGHRYKDEDTYNNDVNVNRNVNRYDDNEGNAGCLRAPEYDREGDGGYDRGCGRGG